MCHAGCFCPKDTPVFDNAQGKCIAFANCPKESQCETNIKADYLDAGNLPQDCTKHNNDGDYCKTSCDSNKCVAKPNFADVEKVEAYCNGLTQDKCGPKGDKTEKYCEWAADDASATGPVFVCSAGNAGESAWAIQSEGQCSAGGGIDTSVCDYLTQTSCLTKGKCDTTSDTYTKCFGLVKTTYSNCQTSCFASSHKDKKCSDCLISNLFKTNTLNLAQPDIFTCCGCLDETFAKVGLQMNQLQQLLDAPCKKHSATGAPPHTPRLRTPLAVCATPLCYRTALL